MTVQELHKRLSNAAAFLKDLDTHITISGKEVVEIFCEIGAEFRTWVKVTDNEAKAIDFASLIINGVRFEADYHREATEEEAVRVRPEPNRTSEVYKSAFLKDAL